MGLMKYILGEKEIKDSYFQDLLREYTDTLEKQKKLKDELMIYLNSQEK